MEDLNDTIKNLKEMIEKRDFIIKENQKDIEKLEQKVTDWHTAYEEQVNMIAYLNETHRDEISNLRITLKLRVAERDSFKEALRIVTRKVRNNG